MPHSISDFRKRVKISQKELAKKLGVANSAISEMEKGKRNPTYEQVALLLGLGATIGELFGIDYSHTSKPIIEPDSDFEKRVITVLNKVFNNGNIRIPFQ